jgi:hypothetical protein
VIHVAGFVCRKFEIAGNQLYWVIADFSNPEYYALRQLPFTK